MNYLPFLVGGFAFLTSVLWLVIGWRAMRAHETLAESSLMIREELRRISRGSEQKVL
jgi:hypothetical protein